MALNFGPLAPVSLTRNSRTLAVTARVIQPVVQANHFFGPADVGPCAPGGVLAPTPRHQKAWRLVCLSEAAETPPPSTSTSTSTTSSVDGQRAEGSIRGNIMSSRSRTVPLAADATPAPPVSPAPEVIELWATLPPAPEKWWAKGFQLRWYDDHKLPRNVLIRYEVPEDAGYTIPPHPNRTRMVLRWEHDSNIDRRNMFVSTRVEYGSQEWHEVVDTATKSGTRPRVDPVSALEEMMEYKARVGRLNPKEAVPADGMTWSEILRIDQSKRVDLFTNLDTATTPLFRQPGSAHADALERSTWRFRYEEVCRPAVSSTYNLSALPELPIRPNPGALGKAIARGYVEADEQPHNNNNENNENNGNNGNNENNNVATFRHATKDASTPDGTHI